MMIIQSLYLMIPEIRFLSQVQLVQQMLVLLLKLSVGFLQLQNLDGSAVSIQAGNKVNGFGLTGTTGEHDQLKGIGFNETVNNVVRSGIVTSDALTLTSDLKINDVKDWSFYFKFC